MQIVRKINSIVLSFLLHIILILLLLFFGFSKEQFIKAPLDPQEMHHGQQPIILTTLTPQISQHYSATFQPPSSSTPASNLALQKEKFMQSIHLATDFQADKELNRETVYAYDTSTNKSSGNRLDSLSQHNTPQERQHSLLAMTGAFIKKQMRKEGNSILERTGDSKKLCPKQLKFLSYQQRIDEQVITSWRIVSADYQRPANAGPLRQSAGISFEIEKDGNLAFVQLVQSSGNARFDYLVLESIRQAAPFPPIPDHLATTHYRPLGGTYNVNW